MGSFGFYKIIHIQFSKQKSKQSSDQYFIQVSNCFINSFSYLTKIGQTFINIRMATRILPVRNTRKKHLRESPSPPKTIKSEPVNEKEAKRKQNESKRKMNQLLNLQKYPYSRAIHYFFNLDQFPRSKCTVSYAQDTKNVFNYTYSKDGIQIKKQKIGDLINRKLIGLPIHQPQGYLAPKQNRCKNICFAYLSQTEDKKHNNERIIYTIKLLIKRVDKANISQFEKYEFIKKDSDLQILLEDITPIQKKSILENKLKSLISRKQVNRQNWLFDDTVFYYHSLNQSLHNKIFQLKHKISEEYINSLVVKRNFQSCNSTTLLDFVKQMTQYYFIKQSALSFNKIRKVVSRQKSQILTKASKPTKRIDFPILILYFGQDSLLHDISEFLLGRRAFSLGQIHFYEVKMMIKKLFKRDLQVRSQKNTSYQQFYKSFRKKYEQICQYKEEIKQQKHEDKSPLLDNKFNEDVGKGESSNLLKLCERRAEISRRQFKFLMIYYWLTRSMGDIYPYLIRINDLIEIIGSDYYSKICNQFVQAIGSPLAGLIFYIFQAFTDLMSKNIKQQINQHLLIEFDKQLNVCVVWMEQMVSKQKQLHEEQGLSIARKKFRQDY